MWEVSKQGNSESAAFNAMLTDAATGGPLLMKAGGTITDHQYAAAAGDGMHVTVTDLTTRHSGMKDFGQALQFQQTRGCPMGGFPQYCSTVLR